jgi:hypothetical protein
MRRLVAAGGVVVCALLVAGLAGCSPSRGAGAAATTTTQQDVAAVWRDLVRCARENGMPNLPEPRIDSEGQPHWPGGVEPPEPTEGVQRACRSIFERFPPSVRGGQPTTPADTATLLRFARCMREHGLADFPDPDANGQFQFAGTDAGRQLKQKDPASPLQTALRACGGPDILDGRIANNG